MRWKVVLANMGRLLQLASLLYIPPTLVSLADAGWATESSAFLLSGLVTLALGLGFRRLTKERDLRDSEAYILVGVGWLFVTALAAIPIMFVLKVDPATAFFEAMSAITTTGATALPAAHTLPKGVLFWRALLQWVGGIGIVVILVAILSGFATSGTRLMQAELPGGHVERLTPKIRSTAMILSRVYAAISGVLFVLLVPLFIRHTDTVGDALFTAAVHTFTTMSTGGFGTHGLSIEAFNDPLLEMVIVVGMLVAGSSFVLNSRALMGRGVNHGRDPEFRFYVTIIGVATLIVTTILRFQTDMDVLTSLRHALFNVTSILTTTGFSSTNFDAWPEAARYVLFFLFFTGGMAGSTAGSIKIVRVYLFFKLLQAEMTRIGHPRAVVPIRIAGRAIESRVVQRTSIFLFMYLTLFAGIAFLVLILSDVEILDALAATGATLGNIGPGLGVVGPHGGYGGFSGPVKVILSLGMWLGRLEIVGVLTLFSRRVYRHWRQ